MFNSVWPHRRQPTRLPRPWESSGKTTGMGCHFLLQCMKVKVKSLNHVLLPVIPWTAAYQAPQSTGFSRQEYWSGVPLPSPTQHVNPAQKGVWASRSQSRSLLPIRYRIRHVLVTKSGKGERQPTPVFLPRGSCGQRSLVGCRLWGCTESDTTEVT